MFNLQNFTPRAYQESILKTSIDYNTLVVLPTGLGKTACAILLSINRLNNFINSKVLICSPTKPLCNQHAKSFQKYTNIPHESISILTGSIKPEKRKEIWQNSLVIVATPQTIESDLNNQRITLENVSLLCIDEAHRSRENFANTKVTKSYLTQAKDKRVLALTASPGGIKEKIKEICEHLNIEKVEIRTEHDEDVKEYMQEKKYEFITISLPEEIKRISNLINEPYRFNLTKLKSLGFTKPVSLINKKDLLQLQFRFHKELSRGDKTAFYKISLIAETIKISHALELIETQGPTSLRNYLEKLKSDSSKAAKKIMNYKNILEALSLTNQLIENKIIHPRLEKLKEIMNNEIKNNRDIRIIIFANFRDAVDEIYNHLKLINELRPAKLIGQKEGLSQKEQVSVIRNFESGVFNCLICTSIAEEGLSLESADLAVFYEPVPSEIRSIQRKGRVGRTKQGRIILLITKGTRDEGYYWSARKKEKTMKSTLYKMKNQLENQETLI